MRRWLAGACVTLLFWAPLTPAALEITAQDEGEHNTLWVFAAVNGMALYVFASAAVTLKGPGGLPSAWLLAGLLAVALQYVAMMVVIHNRYAEAVAGKPRPLRASLKAGLGRSLAATRFAFGSILCLSAINVIAIPLAMVILPAAWPLMMCVVGFFAARYVLTLPAMVVEGLGCTAAMTRSLMLTRNVRASAFGTVLLTTAMPLPFLALGALALQGNLLAIPVVLLGGAIVGTAKGFMLTNMYRQRCKAAGKPALDQLAEVFE